MDNAHDVWIAVKGFVYGAFIFLEMDIEVVKLLGILMGIDTILGIFKAIILGRQFSFKKLLWGIITKVSVLIIPMILAITANALSFDFKWLVEIVLDILVVAESFSAITNIISIKEKKEMENPDFITAMLKRVRTLLRKVMMGLGDTISDSVLDLEDKDNDNDKKENNDG